MEKNRNSHVEDFEEKREKEIEILSFKNAKEMPADHLNPFGCKVNWLEEDM